MTDNRDQGQRELSNKGWWLVLGEIPLCTFEESPEYQKQGRGWMLEYNFFFEIFLFEKTVILHLNKASQEIELIQLETSIYSTILQCKKSN